MEHRNKVNLDLQWCAEIHIKKVTIKELDIHGALVVLNLIADGYVAFSDKDLYLTEKGKNHWLKYMFENLVLVQAEEAPVPKAVYKEP